MHFKCTYYCLFKTEIQLSYKCRLTGTYNGEVSFWQCFFSFTFWNNPCGKDNMAAKIVVKQICTKKQRLWENNANNNKQNIWKYDTVMIFWVEACQIISNSCCSLLTNSLLSFKFSLNNLFFLYLCWLHLRLSSHVLEKLITKLKGLYICLGLPTLGQLLKHLFSFILVLLLCHQRADLTFK